jgi:hypothetical protein
MKQKHLHKHLPENEKQPDPLNASEYPPKAHGFIGMAINGKGKTRPSRAQSGGFFMEKSREGQAFKLRSYTQSTRQPREHLRWEALRQNDLLTPAHNLWHRAALPINRELLPHKQTRPPSASRPPGRTYATWQPHQF